MDTLVSTKLRPSQARPKLVARPRLSERLDPEAGRRLTLVSAPAGFGKTTLLSRWWNSITGGERCAAWLSLDEGDNDPTRFLSYLVTAIRRAVDSEGFGEGVLAALRSPEPRMEPVLGAIVNEVGDLPCGLDIVLDDYHAIDSQDIHRIVSYLLERLPDSAHVVVSSRVDPPLPLARLRARGQMAELVAADLAFTREEAAAFLKGVMGLDLSAADVMALEEITEGWIAGLQLAALSMREREVVSDFIGSFSGSHRNVLDFLAEEVLERQDEDIREFLLQTSILDGLTGPLCDALTGRSDGQETLEKLERDNLFLVALDEERRWYRYHPLFAGFLRERLGRERPESVVELHVKASEWNERNGGLSTATEHALSAGDYERAARLIEHGIGQTWYRGEVATLLGWLGRLPREEMRRRPLLLIWYAAGLMLTGDPEGTETLLDEAEEAVSPQEDGDPKHVLPTAAAVRSLRSRRLGDAREAVEHARRALSLLPEDNLNPRPFVALSLAQAYRAAGDGEAATAAFAEAGSLGRAAGHDYVALSAMACEANLRLARGGLRKADDVLRRALKYAAERGAGLLPAVGSVHIGMGELLYEWDDLERAERHLTEGVELASRTGDLEILIWGHLALAAVKRARGDAGGAMEKAREAEQVARSSGSEQAIIDALTWSARLQLMGGDPAAAASEHERAAAVGEVRRRPRELERTMLARLVIARNRPDEALELLAQLHETAKTAARTIEVLTLRALALRAKGEEERAVGVLAEALAPAEPEGYVRTFVDERPPVGDLLSGALEARRRNRLGPPVSERYLEKLLAAVEQDALAGDASPAAEPPEPLSERELEVLRLVAAGKTNRGIASELFVSVGTVKTHTNNLYRKLEAHSRMQAVARARELNLI